MGELIDIVMNFESIVITQPMYFPWIGILEQIRIADCLVFYEDVQFSKGSFVNRVQIKTKTGIRWLTVPLQELHLGQTIQDVQINSRKDWRQQHLDILKQSYRDAPHFKQMITLVRDVFDENPKTIGQLSKLSMKALCSYFGLGVSKHFASSKHLDISGSGSQRVLDIVRYFGASRYITGLGAANYLDHHAFNHSGIEVEYMDYRKQPYQQLHSEFTPFVSALDLVANCGRDGIEYISSNTMNWKEFLSHE